jgi:hypothetical protein
MQGQLAIISKPFLHLQNLQDPKFNDDRVRRETSRVFVQEKDNSSELFATPEGHDLFSRMESLTKVVHGLVDEVAAARGESVALKAEMKEFRVFPHPLRRKNQTSNNI